MPNEREAAMSTAASTVTQNVSSAVHRDMDQFAAEQAEHYYQQHLNSLRAANASYSSRVLAGAPRQGGTAHFQPNLGNPQMPAQWQQKAQQIYARHAAQPNAMLPVTPDAQHIGVFGAGGSRCDRDRLPPGAIRQGPVIFIPPPRVFRPAVQPGSPCRPPPPARSVSPNTGQQQQGGVLVQEPPTVVRVDGRGRRLPPRACPPIAPGAPVTVVALPRAQPFTPSSSGQQQQQQQQQQEQQAGAASGRARGATTNQRQTQQAQRGGSAGLSATAQISSGLDQQQVRLLILEVLQSLSTQMSRYIVEQLSSQQNQRPSIAAVTTTPVVSITEPEVAQPEQPTKVNDGGEPTTETSDSVRQEDEQVATDADQ